jgi:hypothetical protein
VTLFVILLRILASLKTSPDTVKLRRIPQSISLYLSTLIILWNSGKHSNFRYKKLCILGSCILPLAAMDIDDMQTITSEDLNLMVHMMTSSVSREVSHHCLGQIASINRDIPHLYSLMLDKRFIKHATFIQSAIYSRRRNVEIALDPSSVFKRLTLENFRSKINDIQPFEYRTAQDYLVWIDTILDNNFTYSNFLDEKFYMILAQSNNDITQAWKNFSEYTQKKDVMQILLSVPKCVLLEHDAKNIARHRHEGTLGTTPTVVLTSAEFSKLCYSKN